MPGMQVYVGDTDADAREIERELQLAAQDFDKALAELGRPFAWHDFRQYDLDAPFPQQALKYAERGFRTNAEHIAKLPALRSSRPSPHQRGAHRQARPRPRSHAQADGRVHLVPPAHPVRGRPGHRRRPDHPLVRRPRPRRHQLPHRQPRPVAPLPRRGHPDPPGARHRPPGIRLHHPPRQPRPPRPGKPPHRRPPPPRPSRKSNQPPYARSGGGRDGDAVPLASTVGG